MTFVGDAYWASKIAGKPDFRATTSVEKTAQLLIVIGKWYKFYGPEMPLRLFKIENQQHPSTAMMQVKLFLLIRKFKRGKGVYIEKIRLYWPYMWRRKHGVLYACIQKDGSVLPRGLSNVVDKRIAAKTKKLHTKSSRKRVRYGFYSRATQRPSPETTNSTVMYSNPNESYETNFGGRYTAPIFRDRVYQSHYRTYTGTVTPGFRTMKPSQLPVNPYSMTSVDTDNQTCYVHNEDHGTSQINGVYTFTNGWNDMATQWASLIPAVPAYTDTTTYNKAIQRLIDQAESSIDANIAQDLAQYGQTVRLITHNVNRIAVAARAVRHGNFKLAARSLVDGLDRRKGPYHYGKEPLPVPRRPLSATHSLANNWLELQYGWKPLLQDIRGAMLAITKLHEDSFLSEVRGSAKRSVTDNGKVFSGSSPYVVTLGDREITTDYCVKVAVRYRIANKKLAFLQQTGFTNPINLLWEILPYSFVADWALPIGPWLSQLSAWDGLEFYDGWLTQFMRSYVTLGLRWPLTRSGIWTYSKGSGFYTRVALRHERTKLIAFPRARFPTFKPLESILSNTSKTTGETDFTHAFNALALLASAFSTNKSRDLR
jgi:hypothetical protein